MTRTKLVALLASVAILLTLLVSIASVGGTAKPLPLAAATPAFTVTVATNSSAYGGNESGFISGTVSPPPPAKSTVAVQIDNPVNQTLFSQTAPVSSTGSFNATFTPVPSWDLAGTYVVTAIYASFANATCPSFFVATLPFSYFPNATQRTTTGPPPQSVSSSSTCPSPTLVVTPTSTSSTSSSSSSSSLSTSTTTVTKTVTAPGSTVTSTSVLTSTFPASTMTSTLTTTTTTRSTVTSTSTTTTSTTTVPSWAYGVMVVLLIVGLAIGFVIKGPTSRRPAAQTQG